jgi:hypothetical protein
MIYQFIGVTMIVFGLLFLVQGIKAEIDYKLNNSKPIFRLYQKGYSTDFINMEDKQCIK